MQKLWVIPLALVIAASGLIYFANREAEPADPVGSLTYFIESVTSKTQASVKDYETLGLAGGVDGFVLLKTYSRLFPADFIGVEAYQGSYSEEDGKVLFTGNAASNSGVIERKGMGTLLANTSRRLGIRADTREGVDLILRKLEGK